MVTYMTKHEWTFFMSVIAPCESFGLQKLCYNDSVFDFSRILHADLGRNDPNPSFVQTSYSVLQNPEFHFC